MPRRTKRGPANIALFAPVASRRSVASGKPTAKKTKIASSGSKFFRKDMRFSASLVILTGMLVFSMLLLLISLNGLYGADSKAVLNGASSGSSGGETIPRAQAASSGSYTFQSGGVKFQLSIPVAWKDWAYRTGQVKSPVDDSLSDSYVKIFLPSSPSGKEAGPNLDSRYTDMATILTFSAGEWKKLDKNCQKSDSESCDAMGTKLADAACPDEENADCVFSYKKQPDCPGPLEARCREVDGIMKSFQLK